MRRKDDGHSDGARHHTRLSEEQQRRVDWRANYLQAKDELALATYEAQKWKEKYMAEKQRRRTIAKSLIDLMVVHERCSPTTENSSARHSASSAFSDLDHIGGILSPTLLSFDFDDDEDGEVTLPREPSQLPANCQPTASQARGKWDLSLRHHRIPLVSTTARPPARLSSPTPPTTARRKPEATSFALLPSSLLTMCLCGLRLRLPAFLSATTPPASPSSWSATRKLPPMKGAPRPRHKALHKRHCKREWADGLLFSNLVYALAGLVSLSCGQYFCALFQFGAAVASTAFHRSKETKYLLVDASISSTLAIVFIYFAMHVLKNEWYGILAIKLTQGFMCVFTWLYCGLPGGERYELWHQRWHYVSGFTTITTTLLLAMYMPDFDIIMHELIQDYVIVTEWLQ